MPRYRGIALTSIGVGGVLGVVALASVGAAILPLATAVAGIALGGGYLLSPSWKLEVVVDDDALEVRTPKKTRFRLLWSDVQKVISSPTTNTCFVDGGEPAKSLLVPGDGAPAPYDLVDKAALCAEILGHVAPEKIETVASLSDKKS